MSSRAMWEERVEMYAVSNLAWSTDGELALLQTCLEANFDIYNLSLHSLDRHATLSKLDTTWMEEEMEKIFGKPGDQVTAEEFRSVSSAP